jgi:hypothetical protein
MDPLGAADELGDAISSLKRMNFVRRRSRATFLALG